MNLFGGRGGRRDGGRVGGGGRGGRGGRVGERGMVGREGGRGRGRRERTMNLLCH